MGFLFLWSSDGGGFVSEAGDWEEEVGEKKLMQLRLRLLWGSCQPTLYIYFCQIIYIYIYFFFFGQIIFIGTLSKSDLGYKPSCRPRIRPWSSLGSETSVELVLPPPRKDCALDFVLSF